MQIQRHSWGEESLSPGRGLDAAIAWLGSQCPVQPLLQSHPNLADALQQRLDVLWVIPSGADPDYCIGFFNRIVDELTADVRALADIAWPVPDFANNSSNCPPVAWNNAAQIATLVDLLGEAMLPAFLGPLRHGVLRWNQPTASTTTLKIPFHG